jgi:hypothetical protein
MRARARVHINSQSAGPASLIYLLFRKPAGLLGCSPAIDQEQRAFAYVTVVHTFAKLVQAVNSDRKLSKRPKAPGLHPVFSNGPTIDNTGTGRKVMVLQFLLAPVLSTRAPVLYVLVAHIHLFLLGKIDGGRVHRVIVRDPEAPGHRPCAARAAVPFRDMHLSSKRRSTNVCS